MEGVKIIRDNTICTKSDASKGNGYSTMNLENEYRLTVEKSASPSVHGTPLSFLASPPGKNATLVSWGTGRKDRYIGDRGGRPVG